MKKINISLIAIAIIVSVYFSIFRDDRFVLVLKDLLIILTINGLYIIRKIFKLEISEFSVFIYVLFVFMAHFLGANCELYNYLPWFDKFTHHLTGILSSFVAIYILYKSKLNKNKWFNILFIIALSMMTASLWEIFEYLSSYYFNVDPQKVVLTGVNDTMGDIIVTFLGCIFVSMGYYYEITEKKKLIITKFIKTL